MPQFSNVPTFAEVGLPTIPSVWFGLFLPAGAKPEIVQTWNHAVGEVLAKDDVRARLSEFDLITRGSTPQEFADLMRRDTATWTDIRQAHRIPADRVRSPRAWRSRSSGCRHEGRGKG